MNVFFLVLTVFSATASLGGSEVTCTAPFDEGSHYELRFIVEGTGVKGPAELRYVTTDGLDLRAEMKAAAFRNGNGELFLEAANESMGVRLEAKGEGRSAKGVLSVSFSLDEAGALELATECRL